MRPAVVNALWIGNRMGPIHAACLRSFLRAGHRVVLHVYDQPHDAPAGVEFFDASRLMAADKIVRHRKHDSLALASDIYRYRILREGLGLYVDCDVFCVRPIADAEHIFGWESDRFVGTAVLKFPQHSPVLRDLCAAAADDTFIPPWDSAPKRAYYLIRKALGRPVTVDRQRWGVIGPKAVTWYLRAHGLQGLASAVEVFSPVWPKQQDRFYDAGLAIEDIVTPDTLAIHLRNERIRRRGSEPIPASSPLGRMLST